MTSINALGSLSIPSGQLRKRMLQNLLHSQKVSMDALRTWTKNAFDKSPIQTLTLSRNSFMNSFRASQNRFNNEKQQQYQFNNLWTAAAISTNQWITQQLVNRRTKMNNRPLFFPLQRLKTLQVFGLEQPSYSMKINTISPRNATNEMDILDIPLFKIHTSSLTALGWAVGLSGFCGGLFTSILATKLGLIDLSLSASSIMADVMIAMSGIGMGTYAGWRIGYRWIPEGTYRKAAKIAEDSSKKYPRMNALLKNANENGEYVAFNVADKEIVMRHIEEIYKDSTASQIKAFYDLLQMRKSYWFSHHFFWLAKEDAYARDNRYLMENCEIQIRLTDNIIKNVDFALKVMRERIPETRRIKTK